MSARGRAASKKRELRRVHTFADLAMPGAFGREELCVRLSRDKGRLLDSRSHGCARAHASALRAAHSSAARCIEDVVGIEFLPHVILLLLKSSIKSLPAY